MSTLFTALTVPLDASEQSAHAVDYAIALARDGKTVLHFCSAVDPAGIGAPGAMGAMIDPTPLIDALEAAARRLTEEAEAKARAAHVNADATVLFGEAAMAIAQSARESRSDGILICTHARSSFMRFLAGSITETLLTMVTVPLIVVHQDDHPRGNGPITVAIDGSASSDAALATAVALANAAGRSLLLLHIVQSGVPPAAVPPVLAAAGDLVRATSLDFELVTRHGDAAATIVESAREHHSPLIVMGTRGLSGVGRAVLGSVAAAVIERARIPVVVVRKP